LNRKSCEPQPAIGRLGEPSLPRGHHPSPCSKAP